MRHRSYCRREMRGKQGGFAAFRPVDSEMELLTGTIAVKPAIWRLEKMNVAPRTIAMLPGGSWSVIEEVRS